MELAEMAKNKTLTTEEKCIAYLEKMRWPEGVCCSACGGKNISRFQAKGKTGKVRHLYQCLEKSCRYQFSPTTGTIFHDSHLPLNKWFMAIAKVGDTAKPISVNQLRLALGVQYKTAANILGRIRQAMEKGSIELNAAPASVAAGPAAAPLLAASTASPAGSKPATLISPAARPLTPSLLAERRVETATLLNHITAKPGSVDVSATAVDNMLSMFVSLAQMSVRRLLFFVNYLKKKFYLTHRLTAR